VKVLYHDGAQSGDPEVYHVPGMEKETILPPANNLTDKGRPMGAGRGAGGGGGRGGPGAGGGRGNPAASNAPRARRGAGGDGVEVFGPEHETAKPGILSGNGSVIVGTKGMLATRERGEGVWLLPSARWAEYKLPPQMLTRSPGHMQDWVRACKGGDPGCSDFSITAPYAEWLSLVAIALHVPGKLEWDSKNLRFTNSPEANQFIKPNFRKGWELKL
jgi:hypothetical protein